MRNEMWKSICSSHLYYIKHRYKLDGRFIFVLYKTFPKKVKNRLKIQRINTIQTEDSIVFHINILTQTVTPFFIWHLHLTRTDIIPADSLVPYSIDTRNSILIYDVFRMKVLFVVIYYLTTSLKLLDIFLLIFPLNCSIGCKKDKVSFYELKIGIVKSY